MKNANLYSWVFLQKLITISIIEEANYTIPKRLTFSALTYILHLNGLAYFLMIPLKYSLLLETFFHPTKHNT